MSALIQSSPESIERPGSSGWSFASSSSNDFIAPTFATTAAEFGLYPERVQSTRTRRSLPKHTDTSSSDLSSSHERATSDDLHRLQSDAFWELHRSIAENGEGFVRRMRDYEHSISHVDNAEGALARGRRRSPSSGYSLSSGSLGAALDGDASEEEDVQIFADDLSLSRSDSRRSRSHEMNIDNDHSSSVFGSERCYSSSQSSDVDDLSSHPYTHSGRSEADSLSLVAPMASLSQSVSPLSWPDVSYPSSSKSEKALAALGLAMANGAGNMSDYNALIAFQSAHASQPQYDEVGELWH